MQDILNKLSSINKENRIINADDETSKEGLFIDDKIVHSFTSTDENSTTKERVLDILEIGTDIISPYVDELNKSDSYNTTSINLEVTSKIDHEDMYTDITFVP